jgi:hypothetical protein
VWWLLHEADPRRVGGGEVKRTFRIKIGSGEFMSIEIDDLLHDIFLTLSNDEFNRIALANGYVPAADYEALKAKVAELTDRLEDATDTLDLIESEADLFDATAIASGYVKLEPGQVVVNASDVSDALDALCDTCAGNCEMCPTREILFAIKEARDE